MKARILLDRHLEASNDFHSPSGVQVQETFFESFRVTEALILLERFCESFTQKSFPFCSSFEVRVP
jgi:hypothetical protein